MADFSAMIAVVSSMVHSRNSGDDGNNGGNSGNSGNSDIVVILLPLTKLKM